MKILARYIGSAVMASTATALVALTAIFSFFEFVDEMGDLGRGHYGVLQVVEFVLLSIPRLCYDLFPVAALLGSLFALGALVSTSEMTVIRAAGVSLSKTVSWVMKAGALIMIACVLIGELIAPPCEQLAQQRRSIATTDKIALKTRNGFWARDGRSFVNIRTILPGNWVERIFIYEFDEQGRLKTSTRARRAYYSDGRWILEGIEQTLFLIDRVEERRVRSANWESLLNPDLISLVAINPNHLSVVDLYRYVDFLEANGQDSRQYRHALWLKGAYPLATGAMVLLAIPIVLGNPRRVGTGRRVVIGSCIGAVFHLVNKAAGSLAVVFNLYPALSATAPALVTLAVALVLLRRVP